MCGYGMAIGKALWQGLGIIIFGVFFIILSSVLYNLNYIKSNHLTIFYALSALLIVIGVVMLVLSRRMPQPSNIKKAKQRN